MRILHVTPVFAPSRGGIETVVSALCAQARRQGHHVEVAHVNTHLPGRQFTEIDGVPVHRVPVLGNRLIGYVPGLRELCKRFDVVHVHDPYVLLLTLNSAAAARGRPRFLSTHGGFRHTGRRAFAKRLHELLAMRLLLRSYDRIFCVSRTDYGYFTRYTSNCELVENGVDVHHFGSANLESRPLTQWIYWGRFAANKRVDRLLPLLKQAVDVDPCVRLSLVGRMTVEQHREISDLVDSLHLQRHVSLYGEASEAELLEHIRGAGVFITATAYEGFGLTLLEAMAAGLVVACPDIAPLNHIVRSWESGVFFEFDGGEGDSRTIRDLLELERSQLMRMRDRATSIVQSHDWSGVSDRVLGAYESVRRPTK
jgi:alpha-1,3-mannosyltransferase